MNVIEKTKNDIKAYVRSLNTPENTVYQENELLILSCFAKAQEILEGNEKLALTIPVVVSSLPSECQENWQSNYYCTLSGKCQKCDK